MNSKNLSSVVLIPTRLGSTRLPSKPLLEIKNIPLIIHVYRRAKLSKKANDVIICCDDKKILQIAKKYNAKAILTSKKHKNGTERINEAYKKLKKKYNLIVDVQGDEPLIQPNDIKKIIKAKKKYFNHVICGYADETDYSKIKDKNIIKAVTAQNGDLIYFSRSVIPGKKRSNHNNFKKQVCIYAFSKKQLQKFSKHKKSNLERIEDIELLRFIDLGTKIKLIKVSRSISVDIPKNLIEVEKYLSPRKK